MLWLRGENFRAVQTNIFGWVVYPPNALNEVSVVWEHSRLNLCTYSASEVANLWQSFGTDASIIRFLDLNYPILNAGEQKTEQKFCPHEWTRYVGFTESYMYCKKCDEKWNPNI